ncbi:MAG: WS/DGAT/MGAT family O-acyltransferase [Pseudomonadales bacterium]
MLRLTGNDANFLYQETPTTPQHTLKISVLKLKNREFDLDVVKQQFLATIHRIPALRWRIVPVPFGLHHPVAVEDPEFDLNFHIRHVALPKPGTWRELDEMVGQIASHSLDRDCPLWELWVIEGLSEDRAAFVLKAHHAIADGTASVHLFTRMLSPLDPKEVVPPRQVEALPSGGKLLRDALIDHVKNDAARFPGFVRTTLRSFKSSKTFKEQQSDSAVVDPLTDNVKRSPFNGALSSRRKFASLSLSLGAVKDLKNTLQGTLNDVILALAAGALRRYLLENGDPCNEPLSAMIPVSADEPGVIRIFGNNISIIGTRLHVEIDEPVMRFDAIRRSTNAGKKHLEAFGKSTLPTIQQYIPPALRHSGCQKEYRSKAANRDKFRYPCNVAISNVPGPRQVLETDEAVLDRLLSVGPLQEGNGLNITVWSYADQLNFSIISCEKLVPEPQRIADGVEAELQALQAGIARDGGKR